MMTTQRCWALRWLTTEDLPAHAHCVCACSRQAPTLTVNVHDELWRHVYRTRRLCGCPMAHAVGPRRPWERRACCYGTDAGRLLTHVHAARDRRCLSFRASGVSRENPLHRRHEGLQQCQKRMLDQRQLLDGSERRFWDGLSDRTAFCGRRWVMVNSGVLTRTNISYANAQAPPHATAPPMIQCIWPQAHATSHPTHRYPRELTPNRPGMSMTPIVTTSWQTPRAQIDCVHDGAMHV